MKKRKWLWIISFAVCAASGIVLLTAACSARASGHMKLTVIDAYSLRAIANARIILPEAGLSATSDQNGVAYLYGVPVRTREGALAEVPCDYGETTIFVYAEGYLPFALFHAHVYPDRLRNGPTLYLFPEGNEDGIEVISMIESPAEEWVKRLLDSYMP